MTNISNRLISAVATTSKTIFGSRQLQLFEDEITMPISPSRGTKQPSVVTRLRVARDRAARGAPSPEAGEHGVAPKPASSPFEIEVRLGEGSPDGDHNAKSGIEQLASLSMATHPATCSQVRVSAGAEQGGGRV